jgi:mediator of RNA polymerase II transcription subunit 18, fungi type
MHELLLLGQVPQAKHEIVYKILAGLSAMQPQRIIERHIVYKPIREPQPPGRTGHIGGTQNIAPDKRTGPIQATKELYYMQLVQQLEEKDLGDDLSQGKGQWTLQFYDVPTPGKRQAVMRYSNNVSVSDGDPVAFITAMGYK